MYRPSDELIKILRKKYPKGTRIKLVFMNDARPVAPGTKGTVNHVDDMGTIHVDWDNGRRLGLVYDEDIFNVLEDEDGN